jgi:hypothetical protein
MTKVRQEFRSILQHLSQVPGGVWAAALNAKDVEAEFERHGVTDRMQHELERLIGLLNDTKKTMGIIESHLSGLADAVGWKVDYDEDRDAYVVTGACTNPEDWE